MIITQSLINRFNLCKLRNTITCTHNAHKFISLLPPVDSLLDESVMPHYVGVVWNAVWYGISNHYHRPLAAWKLIFWYNNQGPILTPVKLLNKCQIMFLYENQYEAEQLCNQRDWLNFEVREVIRLWLGQILEPILMKKRWWMSFKIIISLIPIFTNLAARRA